MSRITYDWSGDEPPPGPGDALVCYGRNGRLTGTAYLILTARAVVRREPHPGEIRMAYSVERIVLDEVGQSERIEGLVWRSR